jgi:O-antigen/teichoic acid export membrane protein
MRGATRTSVFKGAILTVSMRWTDRLIGFVSTLILARLLAPADFGVVAMASLVVGLVDVLLSLGVNVALIRNHNATPAHYNTAWTLRLAQSVLAAAIVFVAAPAAALYFNDPRIILVLRFMALSMLLVGMENIGIITFQKEMRFGLDFRFVFLKRIVAFLATILTAWFLRSYWALVIGTLAGRSFGVLLSYRMHPMRPRISLEKLKEIFSVSQWMLVNSIASYVNRNLDKILLGRRANATVVGGYTLADEISAMPSTEVLAPLNRVLFPAFVTAKNDLAELKRLYLLAQGVQSLLGIAAGVGLALVAREAVLVLLGVKWLFVVPFVQVLALANVVDSITTSGRYVLLTMGKIRSAALVNWLQVGLFAIGALLVLPEANALQLASIRVIAVLAEFFVSIWLLMRTLNNVGVPDIVRTVLRPLLATGAMALAVIFMGKATHLVPVVELLLKIATGMIAFPAAVLLMWWAAGKPSGAESYLLGKALSILARRKP